MPANRFSRVAIVAGSLCAVFASLISIADRGRHFNDATDFVFGAILGLLIGVAIAALVKAKRQNV